VLIVESSTVEIPVQDSRIPGPPFRFRPEKKVVIRNGRHQKILMLHPKIFLQLAHTFDYAMRGWV
jgi:hypothetical protein